MAVFLASLGYLRSRTSWSGHSNFPVLELVSYFVSSCMVRSLQPSVQIAPNPHAPNEESRLWQDSTLLAGGLPSLRRGSSCPVRYKNPSHRRKQPLVLFSTPNEQWLITGNCCSPCCAYAMGEAGVDSRFVVLPVKCKPGQCEMEDKVLSMQHVPLSTSLMDPKERRGHYSLAPAASQELPGWSSR